MNVLLVTYSFPPAAGVGVLRAHSLAKYLPENGVRIDVLTARNAAAVGKDVALLEELSPEVTIHRTWTPDLPFALRKALKKLVGGKGRPAPQVQAAPSIHRPAGYSLKRLLGDLLLPDPQVGWLPFALPAARRIVRRRAIDLVLVTVPPFSSVGLVTALRRSFPELPLVLDFRDEWLTTTLDLVSFNNNPRARKVAGKAEGDAVQSADAVVCVTQAAVAELRGRYPQEPPEKFLWVPNGFDRVSEAGAIPAKERGAVVLTYLGTVYGSTDPTPVVEAILRLPAAVRDRLRLRFVGHIETAGYRATLERLGAQVELLGFVPQKEALAHVATTDYLLLITHDPINVAAKLYDYLGAGRPILAAVHPSGDVRQIVESTRAGWTADIGDGAALEQLLSEAVERQEKLQDEFKPDRERIAAFHRKPITQRYAELLREVAGK